MRSGWNRYLRALLWAADGDAHEIVQAAVVEREASKRMKSEFDFADTLTGLDSRVEGGLQMSGSNQLVIDYSTAPDADVTDLDSTTPINALFIEWGGGLRDDQDVKNVVLKLHPNVDGTGRIVTEWVCRLFRLSTVGPGEDRIVLQPIGEARVAESGSVVHDVTFDFVHDGRGAPVGLPATIDTGQNNQQAPVNNTLTRPVTVVMVFAIKGDGEGATNAALRVKSGVGTGGVSGGASPSYQLTHWTLGPAENPGANESNMGGGGAYTQLLPQTSMPYVQVNRQTYSGTGVAVYSTFPLDLGSAPTGAVEVNIEAETPSDSIEKVELRNHTGPGAWFEVADGDLVATDNTAQGGFDLSGLPAVQRYDVRITLTPSSSGLRSPIFRGVAVRELELTDYFGAAVVNKVFWGIDPQNLKGEISEASVTFLKTGERDFRDYATRLFSTNYLGKIAIRLFIGHPDPDILPRRYWLHVDSFDVDDYVPDATGIEALLVSVMERMREPVPPFVITDTPAPGDGQRQPEEYVGVTLKDALDDVVDTLLALPARFRGQLLPTDATDTVSKTITESDGKDEADALCYLAGHGLTTSQGRIKAVRVMEEQGQPRSPLAFFSRNETRPISLAPGFRSRIDEFFVPYGWDEDRKEWTGERRYFLPTAIDKVRSPGVDSTGKEEEIVSKWIDNTTLGDKVAKRKVDHFWFGMMLWEIQSTYRHPYLEVGDPIVIETDQFVGKSPIDGREIKGLVSARATIVQQLDHWGSHFVAWVKSFDDIITSSGVTTRVGYVIPQILQAVLSFAPDGSLAGRFQVAPGSLGVRAVDDAAGFQDDATTRAATAHAVDADGWVEIALAPASTYGPGDTAYVTAFAYETAAGGGSESFPLFKIKAEAPPQDVKPRYQLKPTQVSGVGFLEVAINDPAGSLQGVLFKSKVGAGDSDFDDPTDGSWTADPSAPYIGSASLTEKHPTRIAVAIKWRDTDGNDYFIVDGWDYDFDDDARVTSLQIGFDASGYVLVSFVADEDANKVYFKVGLGSDPASPTAGANDGSSTAVPSATVKFDGSAGTVSKQAALGQRVYVRAVGENGSSVVSANVAKADRRRGDAQYIPPQCHLLANRSGASIVIDLTVDDPTLACVSVEYRERVSGGTLPGGWTGWTLATGTIGSSTQLTATRSVTASDGLDGEFQARVGYTDALGATKYKLEVIEFANLRALTKTLLFNPADGSPIDDSQDFNLGGVTGAMSVSCGAVGTPLYWKTPIALPIGAVITQVRQQLLNATGSDTAVGYFRVANNENSSSALATLARGGGGGFGWETGSISHTVASDEVFIMANELYAASSVLDAGAGRIEVTYSVASYDKTY